MKRYATIGLCTAAAAIVLSTVGGCKGPPQLGSEENPIVWAFVPSGETRSIANAADSVASMLHAKTGLAFRATVATAYAGVIEALVADPPKVHMSSLATFAYILAADRGAARAALVAVRHGSATYRGQIIARRGTGIRTIADLKGRSFARPDPLSTSGWVIPMLTMRAAGLNPEKDLREIVDAGSHDAVVAAVYGGSVEAGSTYVDARTTLLQEHPDLMEQVVVVARTTEIPNDGVQFASSVSPEMREKIVQALLEIAGTEEGRKALYAAYQWEGLEKRGDSFYDPFRQALQAAGLGIGELAK